MNPAPSAIPQQPATSSGILHLEHFLASVLKQSLHRVLTERDTFTTMASQCVQLRELFTEMQAVSRDYSFLAADSYRSRGDDSDIVTAPAASSSSSSPSAFSSSPSSAPLSKQQQQAQLYKPPQRNRILVDLGSHFYTHAVVRDASKVLINLGCGVVLPMTVAEADAFLKKKEGVLTRIALGKTREALRIKYRIRLVTEALARLNAQKLGLQAR